MADRARTASETRADKLLPECKYGDKCYRKSLTHLEQFGHTKRKRKNATPPKEIVKEKRHKQDKQDKTRKCEQQPEPDEQCPSDVPDEAAEQPDDVDGRIEPPSVQQSIKHKFMVEMPTDFYEFWDFCTSINSTTPQDALNTIGLELVGPFDVLAGRCTKVTHKGQKIDYLQHWRYYYDPPEMMTIVKGADDTQFHMGYYRDMPREMPAFVAWNEAANNCIVSPKGENIFSSIKLYIEDKVKKNVLKGDQVKELVHKLVIWAEDKQIQLEAKTLSMKARDKRVVCKTFHGAGIVVSVDKNDVGYRPVPETPGDLKKMFTKIVNSTNEKERLQAFDPLQELITLVQFANDECDYGEGLELGLDLFSFGGEVFHSTVSNLLTMAYQLLGRNEYSLVIISHLENRRNGSDLSVID